MRKLLTWVLLWHLAGAALAAPSIFDYQQQLGLTSEQVAGIKAELEHLGQSVRDGKKHLAQLESEYTDLLAKEASLESARAQLNKIAAQEVDLRMADLTASRHILALLKPEQLKKWKEIQAKVRTGK